MTIINGKVLTQHEELHAAIKRFDIPQVYADYMHIEHNRLLKRLTRLISKKARKQDHGAVQQLRFLDAIVHLLRTESVEEQAYIMLGGLEYAQKIWGAFPNSGPILDLAMKQDDLMQIIAENAHHINLADIMNQPNKIQEQAIDYFLNFAKKHTIIRKILADNKI